MRDNPLEPVLEPPGALRISRQRDGVARSGGRLTVVPPAPRRHAVSPREWTELAVLAVMGLAAVAAPALLFFSFAG
jgi:hypothetical protein